MKSSKIDEIVRIVLKLQEFKRMNIKPLKSLDKSIRKMKNTERTDAGGIALCVVSFMCLFRREPSSRYLSHHISSRNLLEVQRMPEMPEFA